MARLREFRVAVPVTRRTVLMPPDDDFGTGVADDDQELESPDSQESADDGVDDGAGEVQPSGVEAPRYVIEKLKELGFQFGDDYTDDAFVSDVIPELDGYLREREEFAAWKKSQSAAKPEAEPKREEPSPKRERPQISPAVQVLIDEGQIEYDPKTRRYRSEDKSLAALVADANAAVAYRSKKADRLLDETLDVLKEEGLDAYLDARLAELRKEYDSKLKSEVAALRQQSELEKFDWGQFYQKDADGKVLKSGGRPLRNERGKAYEAARSEVEAEYGIADPIRAHQLALKLISHVREPEPKGRSVSERVSGYRSENRLNGRRSVANALSRGEEGLADWKSCWEVANNKVR